MSLTKFPLEWISYIMSFIPDKDNCHLVRSCKQFNDCSNKYGFIKNIKLDYSTNTTEFHNNFYKHKNTIEKVIMDRIDDPFLWLPQFVKHIILESCTCNSYINPRREVLETTQFTFLDRNFYIEKTNLRINWAKFPNLEYINLHVYDVNLNGIENLKNLKKIILKKHRPLHTEDINILTKCNIILDL